MSIPTNEDDVQTATWIVGKRGGETGVYVTTSDIVVKHGRHVRSEREGQTITFIRKNCPEIPVPKVYGSWKERKGERDIEYLAMSKMPGTMLRETWATMDTQDKESVLKDLRAILRHLRKLRAPDTALIGPLDGGPAGDARGSGMEYGEFNEWLVSLIHPDSTKYHSSFYIETIRNSLKCNHQLRFNHGDLGLHDILVEGGRITAIIDWEFAGWYPEYWEYAKVIQFSSDPVFRCFGRLCWEDEVGNQVLYDQEDVIDQMLDSQVRHGQRNNIVFNNEYSSSKSI